MKKQLPSWTFYAFDNGGKRQFLTVRAANKPDAITEGFRRAKVHAAGDIISWDCKLRSAS